MLICLIALHELIINSCKEMELQNTPTNVICIHIYQYTEVVIVQVNDSGRGLDNYIPVKYIVHLEKMVEGYPWLCCFRIGF